jgi:hypothetical protein
MSPVALRVEPDAEAAAARQAEMVLTQTDSHLMVCEITTLSAQVQRNTDASAYRWASRRHWVVWQCCSPSSV